MHANIQKAKKDDLLGQVVLLTPREASRIDEWLICIILRAHEYDEDLWICWSSFVRAVKPSYSWTARI